MSKFIEQLMLKSQEWHKGKPHLSLHGHVRWGSYHLVMVWFSSEPGFEPELNLRFGSSSVKKGIL